MQSNEIIALGCVLWAAFLRHRATLIAFARETNPKSWFEFAKAVIGGAQLSWRQYLFPLKISELPTSYHLLWAFAAIWVGFSPFRFFFGMEWLGWFPGLQIQSLIAWSIAVTIGYSLWLWLEYKNTPG